MIPHSYGLLQLDISAFVLFFFQFWLCEVVHLHCFPTLYMLFICLCVCVKSSTSIGFYVVYLFMCLSEVQHLHWFPTLYMLFICLCVCVKSSISIGFPPSICCLCVCVKSSNSIGFPPSLCCLCVCGSPAPPLVSHPLYVVYLFMCLCEVQHLHWIPTLSMLFVYVFV